MKILIAEDDDVSRFMAVRAVQNLGYECIDAIDGADAWAKYKTHRPDAVISDWMMPHMDGSQLCEKIREFEEGQGYTYFIILTTLHEREYRLEGMHAGADDYLNKPLDREELQLRLIAAERVSALHRELRSQAQELKRINREFFESGRIDALTGISNRLRMQEDLRALKAQVLETNDTACIALFDIDHFKDYNDSHGHVAGDDVLRKVANLLTSACRTGDRVYRYGGEEFLAIVHDADLRKAAIAVDRMREAVAHAAIPHALNEHFGRVTVSAGVAEFFADGEDAIDDSLKRADAALFNAKQRGRNQSVSSDSIATKAAV